MDDIIDISSLSENLDNGSPIKLSSSSCGGGLELLMNEKIKDSSKNIEMEDIHNLENELNNLTEDTIHIGNEKTFNLKSDLFNTKSINTSHVKFEDNKEENINLGKSTASTETDNKTWDGFTKFNNIPLNPDKQIPQTPQMSKEELLKKSLNSYESWNL